MRENLVLTQMSDVDIQFYKIVHQYTTSCTYYSSIYCHGNVERLRQISDNITVSNSIIIEKINNIVVIIPTISFSMMVIHIILSLVIRVYSRILNLISLNVESC